MAFDKEKEIKELDKLSKNYRPHPSYYEQIKASYVQGIIDNNNNRKYPTITELARKYKLNTATLNAYAVKRNWKILRSRFQLKLETETQNKRIQILSDESVKFDRKCFDISNNIIEELEGRLATCTDIFVLESICRSLERAQKVGRLASGESTSNDRKDLVVTFSQGLNTIRKNLESHQDMLKQLKDETVDYDEEIDIDVQDVSDDDEILNKLNIEESDAP